MYRFLFVGFVLARVLIGHRLGFLFCPRQYRIFGRSGSSLVGLLVQESTA